MKRIVFISIVLIWAFILSAAHIQYLDEDLEYKIFNKKSGKIITYYEIAPNSSFKAKLYGVDELEVFTRVINPSKDDSYSYQIKLDGMQKNVEKTVSLSEVSKSLKGEKVSAYNKFVTQLNSYNNDLSFTNLSQYTIILKLDGNNVIGNRDEIEFVNFTPTAFETEKTLTLDSKEYTYYTSNSKKIHLTLEGPVTLKIMSRLMFEYNYVNSMDYRYNVYDNGELLLTFNDTAYKSRSSLVKELPEIIPSNGDKNIVKLSEGIHHLVIEDGDHNRDLLFRFYISKSAIGIRE